MLTLRERSFPVEGAWLRRGADDALAYPTWTFELRTAPPVGVPADDPYAGCGLRLFTEGAPLPLADADDLTGTVLALAEPFDPDSGEPWFTLYAAAHHDVARLVLTFVAREGARYRVRIEAEVHGLTVGPAPLRVDTWMQRR